MGYINLDDTMYHSSALALIRFFSVPSLGNYGGLNDAFGTFVKILILGLCTTMIGHFLIEGIHQRNLSCLGQIEFVLGCSGSHFSIFVLCVMDHKILDSCWL